MVKILSQSGNSLADTYDVEGSIAGIDELETHELGIIHEMGATIASERLSGNLRRGTTGAINASDTWDVLLTDLPAVPTRILGCVVMTDDASRVARAMVAIRDQPNGREIPIFAWDDNEADLALRIQDNGGAVGILALLQNALSIGTLPNMLIGTDQPQPIDAIAFRGVASAFGAGDVTITFLLYIAFTQVGGISSRGLPVFSW